MTPDDADRLAKLEAAVTHVLKYGKVGKQSEKRLKRALKGLDPFPEPDYTDTFAMMSLGTSSDDAEELEKRGWR